MTLQTSHADDTQWGIWDCARLHLNLYDWAGDRGGVLPGGEHKNELILNGLGDLLDLLKGQPGSAIPVVGEIQAKQGCPRGYGVAGERGQSPRWAG